MDVQFLRVADDLGWDVEAQIDRLERFLLSLGAGDRMDEALRVRRLHPRLSAARTRVRDCLLDCAVDLGAHGAMNRLLQRELREAALAAAREQAAEQQSAATRMESGPRPRLVGRLTRAFRRKAAA